MDKNVRERRIYIGEDDEKKPTCLGGIATFFENRKLRKRLASFDKAEIKTFVAQLMFKADRIKCDEETRAKLIQEMVYSNGQAMLKVDDMDDLRVKYGPDLAEWVSTRLASGVNDSSMLVKQATLDYNHLKDLDPLRTWFKRLSPESSLIIGRIQTFTAYISSLIKFSLLIEPGRLRPHLSVFHDQFNELSSFFDCVELSPEELSQRSFDANRLSKARNQKLECIDSSRVVLRLPGSLTDNEYGSAMNQNNQKPADIFGDPDIPQHNPSDSYGTGDFIHANYVSGGPLSNKFICTQAPMKKTVGDFWRMIWQERPEYIFMLCDAVDVAHLGLMGTDQTDYCPVYWPKIMGEELHFGQLIVKNNTINGTMDPLFTVTDLAIRHVDNPDYVLNVQHWQWDWRDYRDYHWPLRLLQRSRVSTRPTVVHCLDGCGRTGTLVYIEVLLMQLLRGTANYEHPLLTCAIFVRLQRRHAIEHYIQYLFACRVILHFVRPFVMSKYQRFSLGYMFKESGFIGNFEELAIEWARKNML